MPVAEKPDLKVIRLSFDSATESCVRLAAFGSVQFAAKGKTGYCTEVAEQLAHKDLVNLAISARRLTESGDLFSVCKNHKVSYQVPSRTIASELGFTASNKDLDLWELLGRIIHSRRYQVYANEFHIKSRFGLLGTDFLEIYKAAHEPRQFKPVCELTTDRVPVLFFAVEDLAQTSLEFLEAAAEQLSEEVALGPYANF